MIVIPMVSVKNCAKSILIAAFLCVSHYALADAPSSEQMAKMQQVQQDIELVYETAREYPILAKMRALYLDQELSGEQREAEIIAFIKVHGKERFASLSGVNGSVATCVEMMTLMSGLTQALEDIEDVLDEGDTQESYFESMHSGIRLMLQELALIQKILHADPLFENEWRLWNLQKSEMTQAQVQQIVQGLQYSLQMQQQQMMQSQGPRMPRWLTTGIGVIVSGVACMALVESGARSYRNYQEAQAIKNGASIIQKTYYVINQGTLQAGHVGDIWVRDAWYSPSSQQSSGSNPYAGPVLGQLLVENKE